MYILGKQWRDGYLEYSRAKGQVKLKVKIWKNLVPVNDLYFVRPNDPRMVVNYIYEIGVMNVARKIISRRNESLRNNKYLSCGVGVILECDKNSKYSPGQEVVFLAPLHPRCVEKVVLSELLLTPLLNSSLTDGLSDQMVLYFNENPHTIASIDLSEFERQCVVGWSEYSGVKLDIQWLSSVLIEIESYLGRLDRQTGQPLPVPKPNLLGSSISSAGNHLGNKKKGVIYGFGQYAKTVILPNLPQDIVVTRVNDLDPCQIGRIADLSFQGDTSDTSTDADDFDIYFIAGYHHTHSKLAIQALSKGAIAVIEKPVATTYDDLNKLTQVITQTNGKAYACFHKRYSPFNNLALADLQVREGDPIHYYCIVYEVKLPPRHWYRWPNSGSRLLSNGCHWIDHFLYLNQYSEAKNKAVWKAQNGDIIAVMELENGASFSMVLTDEGSSRIGVQEYVELRVKDKTVRISNSSHYIAEDSRRIIRKKSINKMLCYAAMYNSIGRSIIEGRSGDSVKSIRTSGRVVLELEESLLHDGVMKLGVGATL